MKMDQGKISKISLGLTMLALVANAINSQLSKANMENVIDEKVNDAVNKILDK